MAASVEFELEEFEYVPATAGTALVRVAGKWHAEAEHELPSLALLVRTPVGDDRVEALPDAAHAEAAATPDGSPWRAAYSLAIHVLTGGTAAFLLDGEGIQLELHALGRRGQLELNPLAIQQERRRAAGQDMDRQRIRRAPRRTVR